MRVYRQLARCKQGHLSVLRQVGKLGQIVGESEEKEKSAYASLLLNLFNYEALEVIYRS